MNPYNIKTILAAALALIERDGWNQPGRLHECYPGEPYSPDVVAYGGRCAHEAILEIGGGTRTGGDAVRALSLTVVPDGRGTSVDLVAWNDARGRTLDQVRGAFRKAIGGETKL
jgi:hypothetical protein